MSIPTEKPTLQKIEVDKKKVLTKNPSDSSKSGFNINLLRTIGIIAHIDAGKTTTTERILFFTGKIHKVGEVHDGETKTDWMQQERDKGITITTSCISCHYKGFTINIVDTPGHVDFTIEVERSLRVLDGAVVIFDAVEQVEPQTLKVCYQADRYKVPLIGFINKLDRSGADFDGCIKDIKKRLHPNPLVMTYPVYENRNFEGIICLLTMKYFHWPRDSGIKDYVIKEIPDEYMNDVKQLRHTIEETVLLIEDIMNITPDYTPDTHHDVKTKTTRKVTTIEETEEHVIQPQDGPAFTETHTKTINKEVITIEETEEHVIQPQDGPVFTDTHNKTINKEVITIEETEEEMVNPQDEQPRMSETRIKNAIRAGTLSREIFPVLCGASLKNKGIQNLIDAITYYLPSPRDRAAVEVKRVTRNNNEVTDADGNPIIIPLICDPEGIKCAFIFKTFYFPKVGLLTFIRVYSGTIRKGDTLFNPSINGFEKISRIVRLEANKMNDIDEVFAGDVAAFLIQNSESKTGSTLCDPNHIIRMSGIEVPIAVVEMALETKSTSDLGKIRSALERLTFDDPSLHFFYNDKNQLILQGMGELHMEIIVSRLSTEYNVSDVICKQPSVSYKATIIGETNLDFTYVKQSGGHGSFAKIKLEIRPNDRGKGIVFENKVQRGEVPSIYIPSVEKGIRKAAALGVMDGRFPIEDFIITLVGGEHHEVDSSTDNFQLAGEIALREIIMKPEAKMRILEPVMRLEINVPSDYMGAVTGDIQRRRGSVKVVTTHGANSTIDAIAPLSEMFGYNGYLKSKTNGYGSNTMTLNSYELVPDIAAEKLLKK